MNNKRNWTWGVNGHNRTYPAYPEEKLEEQIKLAAELGVNCYRLNFAPCNSEDFLYFDKVCNLCEKYSLKLFLVAFDDNFLGQKNPKKYFNAAYEIAKRYKNRDIIYQISNEQDIPALNTDKYTDPVGDVKSHYDMGKYADILACMKEISNGLYAADPNAKTSVNISWRHTAVLDMFVEDGLRFDIIGLDWYWDLDDCGHNNAYGTLKHLCSLPQKEIYISEANAWEGDYRFTEAQMQDYITKAMDFYYNFEDKKVNGFIIYELLDEPDKSCGEAHFGLALNDINGNIGRKKLAFNSIQKYIQSCKERNDD